MDESGGHLQPSEVAANLDTSLARLRHGPSLAPVGHRRRRGTIDPLGPVYRKRFEAVCRMAKATAVAVVTIPAAPAGLAVRRRGERASTDLSSFAMREGAWSYPCR